MAPFDSSLFKATRKDVIMLWFPLAMKLQMRDAPKKKKKARVPTHDSPLTETGRWILLVVARDQIASRVNL